MARKIYIGAGDVAKKTKNIYIGVNNVAKKVKSVYVGDANGKARQVYFNISDQIDHVEFLFATGGYAQLTGEDGSFSSWIDQTIDGVLAHGGASIQDNVLTLSCNGGKDKCNYLYCNSYYAVLKDGSHISLQNIASMYGYTSRVTIGITSEQSTGYDSRVFYQLSPNLPETLGDGTRTYNINSGYDRLLYRVTGQHPTSDLTISNVTINGITYPTRVVINELDYLNFTADGAVTMRWQVNGTLSSLPQLQYHIGGQSTWNNYTLGTDISLSDGQRIDWKNTTTRFSSDGGSLVNYVQLVATGSYSAAGNIVSLINNADPTDEEFVRLFKDCTGLKKAPELPRLSGGQVPIGCYYEMFRGCQQLVTPPSIIDASSLDSYACEAMFYGCVNLISAPELPAMPAGTNCYQEMFRGCTSLTVAPELPASPINSLGPCCYSQMFKGCTSLITPPPELPATRLNAQCYYEMFSGCANLTTAPELPATTLATECYYRMFERCSALTTPPELPATTLAGSCYWAMFDDCTSLASVPELPATQVVANCYGEMFQGCTSLTKIANLPATNIAYGCYCAMYRGCTNIRISATQTDVYKTPFRIPITGTATYIETCIDDMFADTGGPLQSISLNTTYYGAW